MPKFGQTAITCLLLLLLLAVIANAFTLPISQSIQRQKSVVTAFTRSVRDIRRSTLYVATSNDVSTNMPELGDDGVYHIANEEQHK